MEKFISVIEIKGWNFSFILDSGHKMSNFVFSCFIVKRSIDCMVNLYDVGVYLAEEDTSTLCTLTLVFQYKQKSMLHLCILVWNINTWEHQQHFLASLCIKSLKGKQSVSLVWNGTVCFILYGIHDGKRIAFFFWFICCLQCSSFSI